MAQFSVCRQPWDEYIRLVTREDTVPYKADMNPGPMYRGRKEGQGGWLMDEQVQLHYRRYPDERVIANLSRWRHGELVGDVALQQFKDAQPHLLERPDTQGFSTPAPEVYMKLNYKNPATLSRFLTRTGHFYGQDILPMNPEALLLLRTHLHRARQLGLYPKFGNPFWYRTQKDRAKPYRGEYDPAKASVKQTMEHFSYNWLQTLRVKRYFSGIEDKRRGTQLQGRTTVEEAQQNSGYGKGFRGGSISNPYVPSTVPFGEKTTTVPGLMSTAGMRKNRHLYSKSSKKRMGFPNPVITTKKI